MKNPLNEMIFKSKSAALYITLDVLSKNTKFKGILPELLYLFDKDSIKNLFKIYGGKIVEFPTIEEFYSSLNSAYYFYLSKVEKIPDQTIRKFLNLTKNQFKTLKENINKWYDSLDARTKMVVNESIGLRELKNSSEVESIKEKNNEISFEDGVENLRMLLSTFLIEDDKFEVKKTSSGEKELFIISISKKNKKKKQSININIYGECSPFCFGSVNISYNRTLEDNIKSLPSIINKLL